MKKVVSILLLAFAAIQFVFAGDVITKDAKRLPAEARNFISRYFSKSPISHIKIESEILQGKTYEVLLTDRTVIEFDKKGKWVEVDCKRNPVPAVLVPVFAREYVKANFPNTVINKVERKHGGIEVELSNDYSLKFNKKGELVDIDD